MSKIDQRLEELGYVLPPAFPVPDTMKPMMCMVRVKDNRCVVSGHGPIALDGSLALPLGKLGAELDVKQGVHAAHLTALAMLATLRKELGNLDRIQAWVRVFGMINTAPGFNQQTPVLNGFSETIANVFGAEIGCHTRSAVGMAGLPFDIPVEVEAELLIE